MEIYLPNSVFLGNIDPFLRDFKETEPGKFKITANKKWISLHPVALAMVAAFGLTIQPGNVECEKIEAKSKHYFERMGLFRFLNIQSGIKIHEHEPAGRFIPLTQIKNSDSLTKFITDMIPLLHLSPEQAEPIKYIISELARNVLEHACSAYGAIVSAQYYKKSNAIKIGIVDTGVGIKKTITRSHKADTDIEAIRLALIPGITGTTRHEGGTEQNAGAGLFFIKSIAAICRDFFVIYSGNAMYKLLKTKPNAKFKLHIDPFADRHSQASNLPYWRGTVVGIDISLDTTKEFSRLLDELRIIYRKAVRERKEARYRQAKFI